MKNSDLKTAWSLTNLSAAYGQLYDFNEDFKQARKSKNDSVITICRELRARFSGIHEYVIRVDSIAELDPCDGIGFASFIKFLWTTNALNSSGSMCLQPSGNILLDGVILGKLSPLQRGDTISFTLNCEDESIQISINDSNHILGLSFKGKSTWEPPYLLATCFRKTGWQLTLLDPNHKNKNLITSPIETNANFKKIHSISDGQVIWKAEEGRDYVLLRFPEDSIGQFDFLLQQRTIPHIQHNDQNEKDLFSGLSMWNEEKSYFNNKDNDKTNFETVLFEISDPIIGDVDSKDVIATMILSQINMYCDQIINITTNHTIPAWLVIPAITALRITLQNRSQIKFEIPKRLLIPIFTILIQTQVTHEHELVSFGEEQLHNLIVAAEGLLQELIRAGSKAMTGSLSGLLMEFTDSILQKSEPTPSSSSESTSSSIFCSPAIFVILIQSLRSAEGRLEKRHSSLQQPSTDEYQSMSSMTHTGTPQSATSAPSSLEYMIPITEAILGASFSGGLFRYQVHPAVPDVQIAHRFTALPNSTDVSAALIYSEDLSTVLFSPPSPPSSTLSSPLSPKLPLYSSFGVAYNMVAHHNTLVTIELTSCPQLSDWPISIGFAKRSKHYTNEFQFGIAENSFGMCSRCFSERRGTDTTGRKNNKTSLSLTSSQSSTPPSSTIIYGNGRVLGNWRGMRPNDKFSIFIHFEEQAKALSSGHNDSGFQVCDDLGFIEMIVNEGELRIRHQITSEDFGDMDFTSFIDDHLIVGLTLAPGASARIIPTQLIPFISVSMISSEKQAAHVKEAPSSSALVTPLHTPRSDSSLSDLSQAAAAMSISKSTEHYNRLQLPLCLLGAIRAHQSLDSARFSRSSLHSLTEAQETFLKSMYVLLKENIAAIALKDPNPGERIKGLNWPPISQIDSGSFDSTSHFDKYLKEVQLWSEKVNGILGIEDVADELNGRGGEYATMLTMILFQGLLREVTMALCHEDTTVTMTSRELAHKSREDTDSSPIRRMIRIRSLAKNILHALQNSRYSILIPIFCHNLIHRFGTLTDLMVKEAILSKKAELAYITISESPSFGIVARVVEYEKYIRNVIRDILDGSKDRDLDEEFSESPEDSSHMERYAEEIASTLRENGLQSIADFIIQTSCNQSHRNSEYGLKAAFVDYLNYDDRYCEETESFRSLLEMLCTNATLESLLLLQRLFEEAVADWVASEMSSLRSITNWMVINSKDTSCEDKQINTPVAGNDKNSGSSLTQSEQEAEDAGVITDYLILMLQRAREIARLEMSETNLCSISAENGFQAAYQRLPIEISLDLNKLLAIRISSLLDNEKLVVKHSHWSKTIDATTDLIQVLCSQSASEFQHFYELLLCRRLIHKRYLSLPNEKRTLLALPAMSRCAAMIRDIELTPARMVRFQRFVTRKRTSGNLKLSKKMLSFVCATDRLTIHTLAAGTWPNSTMNNSLFINMKMPPDMKLLKNEFLRFLEKDFDSNNSVMGSGLVVEISSQSGNQQASKRRLQWSHGAGTALLKATIRGNRVTHIQLDEPQMILVLFLATLRGESVNGGKKSCTTQQLCDCTGLSLEAVNLLVVSLTHPSAPILELDFTYDHHSNANQCPVPIHGNDRIRFSESFLDGGLGGSNVESPVLTHPVTLKNPAASSDTNSFHKDATSLYLWRNELVDASIVRILKSICKEQTGMFVNSKGELLSAIPLDILSSKVKDDLQNRCDICEEDVMRRAERLVSAGMIEKVVGNKNSFRSVGYGYLITQAELESEVELVNSGFGKPQTRRVFGEELFLRLVEVLELSPPSFLPEETIITKQSFCNEFVRFVSGFELRIIINMSSALHGKWPGESLLNLIIIESVSATNKQIQSLLHQHYYGRQSVADEVTQAPKIDFTQCTGTMSVFDSIININEPLSNRVCMITRRTLFEHFPISVIEDIIRSFRDAGDSTLSPRDETLQGVKSPGKPNSGVLISEAIRALTLREYDEGLDVKEDLVLHIENLNDEINSLWDSKQTVTSEWLVRVLQKKDLLASSNVKLVTDTTVQKAPFCLGASYVQSSRRRGKMAIRKSLSGSTAASPKSMAVSHSSAKPKRLSLGTMTNSTLSVVIPPLAYGPGQGLGTAEEMTNPGLNVPESTEIPFQSNDDARSGLAAPSPVVSSLRSSITSGCSSDIPASIFSTGNLKNESNYKKYVLVELTLEQFVYLLIGRAFETSLSCKDIVRFYEVETDEPSASTVNGFIEKIIFKTLVSRVRSMLTQASDEWKPAHVRSAERGISSLASSRNSSAASSSVPSIASSQAPSFRSSHMSSQASSGRGESPTGFVLEAPILASTDSFDHQRAFSPPTVRFDIVSVGNPKIRFRRDALQSCQLVQALLSSFTVEAHNRAGQLPSPPLICQLLQNAPTLEQKLGVIFDVIDCNNDGLLTIADFQSNFKWPITQDHFELYDQISSPYVPRIFTIDQMSTNLSKLWAEGFDTLWDEVQSNSSSSAAVTSANGVGLAKRKSPSLTFHGMYTNLNSSFVSQNALTRSFSGLEEAERDMMALVTDVKTVLHISEADSLLLLIHYNWNVKLLIEQYVEDSRAVRREAGLGPASLPAVLRYDIFLQCTTAKTANTTEPCMNGSPTNPSSLSTVLSNGGNRKESSQLKISTDCDENMELKCGICWSVVNANDLFALCCRHWYCSDCWSRYIEISTNDRNPHMRCPQNGCNMRVTSALTSVVTSNEVSRHHRSLLLRTLVESRTYKQARVHYCKNPKGCVGVLVLGDDADATQVFCALCRSVFCAQCDALPHAPATCDMVKKWEEKGGFLETASSTPADLEAKKLKHVISKPCPRCGLRIEKTGGCPHMICKRNFGGCSFEFCWECSGPYHTNSVCQNQRVKGNTGSVLAFEELDKKCAAHFHARRASMSGNVDTLRLLETAQQPEHARFLRIKSEAWQALIEAQSALAHSCIVAYYVNSTKLQFLYEAFNSLTQSLQLKCETEWLWCEKFSELEAKQSIRNLLSRKKYYLLTVQTEIIGGIDLSNVADNSNNNNVEDEDTDKVPPPKIGHNSMCLDCLGFACTQYIEINLDKLG